MSQTRHKHSAGFTLVEILVVLVITGLVSSILFQALAQIYKLQGRFGQQLAQSQQGVMYADWYRQLVQGLQTDYPLGTDIFAGTDRGLKGLSITALALDFGAPTRFELKVNYDASRHNSELLYEAGASKTTLYTWPGEALPKFAYLDAKGEKHEQWPPAMGAWPQLPAIVLLSLPQVGGGAQVIAAVPRGDTEAKRRQFRMGGTP